MGHLLRYATYAALLIVPLYCVARSIVDWRSGKQVLAVPGMICFALLVLPVPFALATGSEGDLWNAWRLVSTNALIALVYVVGRTVGDIR